MVLIFLTSVVIYAHTKEGWITTFSIW